MAHVCSRCNPPFARQRAGLSSHVLRGFVTACRASSSGMVACLQYLRAAPLWRMGVRIRKPGMRCITAGRCACLREVPPASSCVRQGKQGYMPNAYRCIAFDFPIRTLWHGMHVALFRLCSSRSLLWTRSLPHAPCGWHEIIRKQNTKERARKAELFPMRSVHES